MAAQGPGTPGTLSPYPEVIDTADVRGWTTWLVYNPKTSGWVLEVRERGAMVVRAVSHKQSPECFRELGVEASEKLAKSGRLA